MPPDLTGFGQTDLTQGRAPYDYRSGYRDPIAVRLITVEALYVAFLLFSLPSLIAIFWLEFPNQFLHLPPEKYASLFKYLLAWMSGTLGGTLFCTKWLYHSVARGIWIQDRLLWRLFTPHVSGCLSFFIVALFASGLLQVIEKKATDAHCLVAGIGFLVGYFSDSALAKLGDVAETLFGTVRSKERHGDSREKATQKFSDPSNLKLGGAPPLEPGEGPQLKPGEGPQLKPGEGPQLKPGEGPQLKPGEASQLEPGEAPQPLPLNSSEDREAKPNGTPRSKPSGKTKGKESME